MENIHLKSGFGAAEYTLPREFEAKVESMLQVLLEKAMGTASHYVKAAKRNAITPTDMKYAMMFEAHEFWDRPDLEERFGEIYTDAIDDSESEYDSDSESCEADDSGDEFCEADDSDAIAAKMNKYAREWSSWNPEDPLQIALKNAIDNMG